MAKLEEIETEEHQKAMIISKRKRTKKKYTIIIPTYNERLNIALVIYLVFKYLQCAPFSLLLSFFFNPELGQRCSGTAYYHGLKHASGDFIIIMDADLSHHVSKILAKLHQVGIEFIF
ncbi:hypothetical protein BHE74_00033139 [Ensete ventricosum]|nr:hypothetical protein GW17_00008043 [Ensete ventricosum]RWW59902.1 hypothetical protein BHE74_00033139 [Ensete ventricosum]